MGCILRPGRLAAVEDLVQFVGDSGLELLEVTVLVAFVGAPALERGSVAEAVPLEVVEGDLAHERRAEVKSRPGSAPELEGSDISTPVDDPQDLNVRRCNFVEDGPGPQHHPPGAGVSGDRGTGARELAEAECALQKEPHEDVGGFGAPR